MTEWDNADYEDEWDLEAEEEAIRLVRPDQAGDFCSGEEWDEIDLLLGRFDWRAKSS